MCSARAIPPGLLSARAHSISLVNVTCTFYITCKCHMTCISEFLPSSVMLPPKRLEVLLKQALLLQAKNCVYHNSDFVPHISNSSLLEDHNCTRFVVLFRPTSTHLGIGRPLSAFTFSTFMYLCT